VSVDGPDDVDLADVLASAADGLAGVAARDEAGTTTWRADASAGAEAVPFATLTSGRAEFRLDPLVARAASRTPDTTPSSRGPDWVAFAPAELDDAAIDRAEAWFLSAHRQATGARHRPPG
jgi:hypothetical protein